MNGSVHKTIVGISKSGFWRVTLKGSWYSLERETAFRYVKIDECDKESTFDRWCEKFDIIKL